MTMPRSDQRWTLGAVTGAFAQMRLPLGHHARHPHPRFAPDDYPDHFGVKAGRCCDAHRHQHMHVHIRM
jgi:hypothetical protein